MLKLVRLCFVAAMGAAVLAAVAAGAPPNRASYIVVLNANAGLPATVATQLSARWGGDVSHVYSHALQGFALTLPPQAVAVISHDPHVAYVEADGVVSARHDPDGRHLGPRPHRPARAAAQRHLHLHAHRRRREGLHHRHRHPHHAHAVRRPRDRSASTRSTTAARPTTATATARTSSGTVGGSTYGVAKGVTLVARARARLQRQRHDLRRHRRHRLGDRQPRRRPARGREHEPRRRRVDGARHRGHATRSPTA